MPDLSTPDLLTPDLLTPDLLIQVTELTADLVVTVPAALVGDTEHRLRIYLALKDQAPAAIDEVPMPALARTIIPVELTKGVNDFSITVVGPAGESDPSLSVRYVLDQVKPPIEIASPKAGAGGNRRAPSPCLDGPVVGRSGYDAAALAVPGTRAGRVRAIPSISWSASRSVVTIGVLPPQPILVRALSSAPGARHSPTTMPTSGKRATRRL